MVVQDLERALGKSHALNSYLEKKLQLLKEEMIAPEEYDELRKSQDDTIHRLSEDNSSLRVSYPPIHSILHSTLSYSILFVKRKRDIYFKIDDRLEGK